MKSSILFLFTLVCIIYPLTPLAETTDPASAAKPWTPPPPDNYDWIQLVSGEWLKGELIAMYEGTVEFDSE
ncbi:MAG: hypothetical protein GY934_07655 [Gammaproteobacteria bacterium]|nr:hypothetical protein [Gammaproteobacteria bacterium]